MAIDSEVKRKSIVSIGFPAAAPGIVPSGSFDAQDRKAIAYTYAFSETVAAAVATTAAGTVEVLYQAKELSIKVYTPLAPGSSRFVAEIADEIETYSHTISAIGGFDNASITINDNQNNVENWIKYGLGRHIEVYSPDLEIVWEGFVNKITGPLGSLQFTIGPLLDIGNKVAVSYTPTDNSVDPPVVGSETLTSFSSDTDSQAIYGIIEKIIPGNSAKDVTDATNIQTKFLNDPAGPWPATSRDENLAAGSGPAVQLELLGYWHWLTTYYYTDTNTGTRARSTKIQDLLAAEPNSIFSTDYGNIATNSDTIQRGNAGKETALTIIKEVNKTGISNNRSIMGFYDERKFYYSSVPSTYDYTQRLSDNRGIVDSANTIVRPWDVRPGKWIFYSDFLIGEALPTTLATLQADLRSGFIEMVRYDAPYGLSINGIKLDDFGLFLEKMNLKNGGT